MIGVRCKSLVVVLGMMLGNFSFPAFAANTFKGKTVFVVNDKEFTTAAAACGEVARGRQGYSVSGSKDAGDLWLWCELTDTDGNKTDQHYGGARVQCPAHSQNVSGDQCECDEAFVVAGAGCRRASDGGASASAQADAGAGDQSHDRSDSTSSSGHSEDPPKCRTLGAKGNQVESAGAKIEGRKFEDPFTGETHDVSATAKSSSAMATSIRADMGEAEAYRQALQRGEIGLQRPIGANSPGADFITVKRGANGDPEIIVTDVKTTTTGRAPPTPKQSLPKDWIKEVDDAIGRLSLGDSDCAAAIQKVYDTGTWKNQKPRQLHVNYASDSSSGAATISGW